MKKYYYILGLKEDCSEKEIEKRYKQLSKEFSVDNIDDDLKDFFKKEYAKVQEAYKIIKASKKPPVFIEKETPNKKKTEEDLEQKIIKLNEKVQKQNLEIDDLKGVKQKIRVKELPNATATLVLGILAVVFMGCYLIPGIVLGIIALMVSSKDQDLLERNPNKYSNSGSHKAGRICAKIGIYFPLCLIILGFLFFLFFRDYNYY